MIPPEPRSLARSVPERVRFTLQQLLRGNLRSLATRWYLAAVARERVRLQGWLELLDPA